VENPPTAFQQNYYSCYPDKLSTLQVSVGVASGNTSLTLPLLVFLLLPLIYYILALLKQV
jgi:hypothetical protein